MEGVIKLGFVTQLRVALISTSIFLLSNAHQEPEKVVA